MTDTVLLERRGAAAIVTLNRPEKLNALDEALMRDLDRVTREVAEDAAVRAVMLRGAGRAFMAGGDVAFFHAHLDSLGPRFEEMGQGFHASVKRLRTMPKPVLACVHGAVAGGGLSVMLACDLAIASARRPVLAGLRQHRHLARRRQAPSRCRASSACARPWSWPSSASASMPTRPARSGLVNWVVDPEELEARAAAMLERLAAGPTFAYGRTKALFNETWERPMAEQLDAELASFGQLHPDARLRRGHRRLRGRSAPPVFKGGRRHGHARGKDPLHHRRLARHRPRDRAARRARRGQCRDRRQDRRAASRSSRAPSTPWPPRSRRRAARRSPSPSTCATRPPSPRPSRQAARAFGGIDVLVNNASAISLTPTLETPARRFDLMMGVNVRATFLCSQACIPHLRKAGNPHILNLAPPLAMKAKWFAPHTAYTISKYGMSLCTLGMAEEFAPDGIAVNSLWPRDDHRHRGGGVQLPRRRSSRRAATPAIMADAAHAILTSPSRATTGNFFLDEEVLRAAGVTDFDRYAVTPGVPPFKDLFVE